MKLIILFCLVLLVSVSQQIPQYVNCTEGEPIMGNAESSCIKVFCAGPERVSALACPLSACPPGKKEETVPGDLTKVYPECCDQIICS